MVDDFKTIIETATLLSEQLKKLEGKSATSEVAKVLEEVRQQVQRVCGLANMPQAGINSGVGFSDDDFISDGGE